MINLDVFQILGWKKSDIILAPLLDFFKQKFLQTK